MEFLISTSNSEHERVSLQFAAKSCRSNKIKVFLDPNDWNGDIVLSNILSNHLIDFIILSWLKFNRSFIEKFITLLIEFLFRDSKEVDVCAFISINVTK